uniref:Glutaredoxin-2, mitochondrial n=1 Tax=Ciona savignyi TaxID=51511 RepID=H2YZF2_CIOSA
MGGNKSSPYVTLVQKEIAEHKVQVFSKSWCSYCKLAKKTLSDANVDFNVMELDQRSDGDQIQQALSQITGANTVPRVFINGKCIGGGTETRDLHAKGKLIAMVNA